MAWLEDCPSVSVAGVAHSAREAIDRIGKLSPDIVLMNMTLPDMSALGATRLIKARPAAPLVIVTTFHDSSAIRAEAEAAGADGVLAMPEITSELFLVVDALLSARAARPDNACIVAVPPAVRPVRPREVKE